VVEKAISRSMKYFIGELNTEQTRTRVLNTVNPFLRDIKAKQGITDYVAICDKTNNTPQVIDTNGLALDIALKPSRTIDFVYLNFYSVPTGVDFKEVFK
jgi:phage tail sheath protein FI